MFDHVICLKFEKIRYIQIQNIMIKTRKVKLKVLTTKKIKIIMMIMKITIGNRIKV